MSKNNNLGRFILVAVIVFWALIEVYPPTSRDLVEQFRDRAVAKDAAFNGIMDRVKALDAARPDREFTNLLAAIGTNDITSYFPFVSAKDKDHPTTLILNQLQKDAAGKIKLGIDLQGGTSFLVAMNTNVLVQASTNKLSDRDIRGAIAQAVEVLRKRVDAFGVAEPVIQPVGEDEILIQLPGLSQADKDRAQTQIQKSAYLEFRMAKDDSDEILRNNEPIPPGYEVLKVVGASSQPGKEAQLPVVVSRKAEPGLAGDIVKNARVGRDNMGNLEIDFELNPDAAIAFGNTTRKYQPSNGVFHRLAVILDGELYTAPTINGPIEAGHVQITGKFSPEEAKAIADVLENPLRAPLRILSSEDVSPTMGSDAIRSGVSAAIYALIFVSLFMLLYYWKAGIAANVALVLNVIILIGVMCSVGTTWTLPGIAGVVLTIGMAVDANVLIYERLREEQAKGKSLRGALEAGYQRAFGTIFDSHVTTLISSIILIFKGTGEIQGFGVTLTIGVAASLFTALVVTRLIFNFMLDRNLWTSIKMAHIIKSSNINFMAIAKPVFVISWVFAIAAIICGGVVKGHKLFGVDFVGGDSTVYSFAQPPDIEQIRQAAAAAGEKEAQIQFQKDVGAGTVNLSVTTSSGSSGRVAQALISKFPAAKFKVISTRTVGATVGEEIRDSAIIASLMALLGILIYVSMRYEFSFAVAAVVAVVHDVVLTIGCYCLAGVLFDREFNATVMAAILTIIGFSINDKIVIFDRIREDLKLGVRGTFQEVINQALNQTLSRTIITSGTVFIATACLYILGGGVINDFAFTFLVGIITGTYSSIYIASAIVLWWHKGERPDLGASQVTVQNTGKPMV